MAVDLNELTRNSLTEAYKDQISHLFGTLLANVAGGQTPDQAIAEFARGVKLAQTAYSMADETLIP